MGNKEKEDKVVINGEIVEVLPDTKFKVELVNGQEVLCYLGGKMRVHYIKITTGDWVTVELSIYDLSIGRIIRRLDEYESKRLAREKRRKQEELLEPSNES